ncbi:primosomal protein DnaI [Allobacillus sp. GCM10007491]|uniref:Primosomal protein DnaI n=2 Tax=Allobacillus TaxID=1400133 RepID=A0A941CUL9_9BACI|nr:MULTISPECIES: primosomal protein DnaI [Allobacillus]MBR7554248.1 primosomal protein DnaI [Allobacillus saliphilus]TSJ66448.1 primosomal protein DnaI [Allobacillus salarius]
MEPIQTALSQWLKGKENYQASMNEMKSKILSSPEIQAFLAQHPQITNEQIEKQLIKLYEFDYQSKACENCPSLDGCVNVVQGYAPEILVENEKIKLIYHECPRKEKAIQQQKQRAMVKSLHMPREIHEASFDQVHLQDDGRVEAFKKVQKFYHDSKTNLPSRGLYLYGQFGVGKTYMLAALANHLAEEKIDTYFIYMPELVREMKSSISDSTISEKIERFKNATVLVLDDIGAEFLSPWFRDEILGAILQYRMMERLPVFFTSNYTPDELEAMLSQSGRGKMEQMKSARIMERIRQVSEPVEMNGKNYRDFQN